MSHDAAQFTRGKVKVPGRRRPAHRNRTTTYCVTDLKGPNVLVVLQRTQPLIKFPHLTLAPLESSLPGGAFLYRPTALRGSHCSALAADLRAT